MPETPIIVGPLAKRKAEAKRVQRENPGVRIGWRGGVLYNLDTWEQASELRLPKPGKASLGREMAEPLPRRRNIRPKTGFSDLDNPQFDDH